MSSCRATNAKPIGALLLGPEPWCVWCGEEYRARMGLVDGIPVRAKVGRFLVIRDTSSGVYRMIVHCHGAVDLIELRDGTEAALAVAAFK